ncbi:MAG: hypothetical protein ACE5JL_10410 [Dehalococcoidia bacterium]
MSDDVLAIIRGVEGGLEVEPLDDEGEGLLQEAKQLRRKVTVKTQAQQECALEPEIPGSLSLCAAIADLKAAREGELDTVALLARTLQRELLRERWERGELDYNELADLEG